MEFQNFSLSAKDYFILSLLLPVIIYLRYWILAKAYQHWVYNFFKKKKSKRILEIHQVKKSQINKELIRSAYSAVIFSTLALFILFLFEKGHTAIYFDWSEYAWWYHPLSIFIFLFVQDTYYYWLHRWMHQPRVYRLVHSWHHESVQTNSLTSFSFHPFETILQAMFIPLLLIWIPIQVYSLLLASVLMTITAIINHGAVEVYPQKKSLKFLQKWFIGATHHDVHHRKFSFNYGLYFTFWDRVMGTEKEEK
ncbi:MAG: lathosterol oxidase [Polaribacter sp.]|jgi:lathosterol oxidase